MAAGLSICELASLKLPVGSEGGRLLMLKLYLDDTGTHSGSPVVGVGGLIGTEAQWVNFDARWKALLAEPLPGAKSLKKWHSYDCRWATGEFADFSQADRDLITWRFREVITHSGVYSIANMIDGLAWSEIMNGRFGPAVGTAETFSLCRLMDRISPFVRKHSDGPDMAVYYDKGRVRTEVSRVAEYANDPNGPFGAVTSFTFIDVVMATPLQGADMIATESFWFAAAAFAGAPVDNARAHFRDYLNKNWEKGNGEYLNRASVEAEAKRRHADGVPKSDFSRIYQWSARLS